MTSDHTNSALQLMRTLMSDQDIRRNQRVDRAVDNQGNPILENITLVAGPGPGTVLVVWGSILGEITDQADLQDALDALQAAIDDARARTNHTGTQAISTVDGLQDALNAKRPGGWDLSPVLGSNVSTTSATDQTVTGLNIPIGANEAWEVVYLFFGGCEGAGGTRIGITTPSGASQVQSLHAGDANATGATWVQYQALGSGSLPRDWGKSAVLPGGGIIAGGGRLHTIVHNGATPGNISLVYRSNTAGQTSWISSATKVSARRIS